MNPDERAFLEQAVRDGSHEQPCSEPAADADDVAAYRAGAMIPEQVERFEARLASDDALREAWRLSYVAEPSRVRPLLPLALAALALLAVGTFAWWMLNPRPFDERLADRLAHLQSRAPDPFASHRLVPVRVPLAPPTKRSGLGDLAPRGKLLSGAPVVSWSGVPGDHGARIRVVAAAGGRVAVDQTVPTGTTTWAWPEDIPPLTPGAWLLTCAVDGVMGRRHETVRLQVAHASDPHPWQHSALGDTAIDHVLRAHLAANAGYWVEALRLLDVLPHDGAHTDHTHHLRTHLRARLRGATDAP